MAILNLGELKKLIEHLPGDYDVSFKDETTTRPISSTVEIDTENRMLIFK